MSTVKTVRYPWRWLASLALAAAGVVPGTVALAASPEVPVGKLDGAMTLGSVIDRIGRPSDVSDAGGACGGIVVHDWVAENIRVVTLGEMVDVISPIREEQKPANRTTQPGPASNPGG